jgi:glycosyltransferase involved in cell wall biosynthesis
VQCKYMKKRKNKSVCVVMSVLNGAQYLSEQIDSIINQLNVDVYIYIRDDGSNKETKNILKNYSDKYRNIIIRSGKNIGIKNSFLTALSDAPFETDYYAFSDGDDVWLPSKLLKATEYLSKKNDNIPQGYCSQITLVDSDLNFLRFGRTLKKPITYGNALVECRMSGATAVFNKAARQLISKLPFSGAVMHDAWVNLLINATGEVYFDPKSHILYRQHQSNADGGTRTYKQLWRDRAHRFNEIERYSSQAGFLIDQGLLDGNDKYLDMAIALRDIFQSFGNRFLFLLNRKIYFQRFSSKILATVSMRVGKISW